MTYQKFAIAQDALTPKKAMEVAPKDVPATNQPAAAMPAEAPAKETSAMPADAPAAGDSSINS